MFWLIVGILLWSLVHLFPSLMPERRAALLAERGNLYQGGFALLIVLSLVLIVIGWRSTPPEAWYVPPSWGRHLNMLLTLIAIILLGASHAPTRIRQYLRHPMLSGVAVWAFGHLLANGETRSVLLFGGMLIWSLVSIYTINRRDGHWKKPAQTTSWAAEIKLLLISLLVYVVLIFLHPYFAGMPVVAH
ncbi:MAG: NnrU family protein [Thiolinea sp.]